MMSDAIAVVMLAGVMSVLSGCSSYTPNSQAWKNDTARWMNKKCENYIGLHKSKIIQRDGPPTVVTADGKNGEVLTYDSSVNSQTKGTAQINPFLNTITYNAPAIQRLEKYRQIFCNAEGIAYHWRWKIGLQSGCRPIE